MKLSTIFRPAVLFMAALMCICFTGCGKTPGASQTQIVLGTVVTVQVYGRQSQEALDGAVEAAMDRARELEQIFSVNIDSSEINYVNQNAAKAPVHVSDDFYTVLERSLYFARLTEGAFDPTLGKLIRLWGIGTDDARVPEPEEIAPLTGRRDYEHVLLDEQAHTVFFENDGFSLDLGAIAKGYAADEMKELLQEDYHITSALLNLGGNIITIGNRPDGKPWTLGIADPSCPQPEEDPAVTLQVTDLTFVTSGDYQRYYEAPDGTRYHHILDGSTGYPADSGLSSVTIITQCSMDADALSTASFVLGQEKAQKLLQSINGVEAVFIDTQDQITATDGIRDQLQ